jgi:G3E family GTPase
VQLLVDQIEFANVLVITKCDLVDQARLDELDTLLHLLNPTARIVRSARGNVPIAELLDTQQFSEEWAAEHRHWLVVKRGEEVPETDEYGFGSFVFEARRPFHPVRLRQMVEGNSFDGVVRSKGVVWLATRHDQAGEWSHAGRIFSLHPAGMWVAAAPPEDWPDDPEFQDEIDDVWQEPWGDRRIELVIIGRYLDQERVTAALNECLLSDEELAAGPAVWDAWDDPFDLWEEACDLPEENR